MTGTVRVAVPRISAKQNATDQYQGTLCERKMCVQTFLLFFPNSWTALNLVHKNKIKEKRKRDTNFTIKQRRNAPCKLCSLLSRIPLDLHAHDKFTPGFLPKISTNLDNYSTRNNRFETYFIEYMDAYIWIRIRVYIYIYIYLFKILESGRTGRKKNREEERAFLNEWIATSDLFRV